MSKEPKEKSNPVIEGLQGRRTVVLEGKITDESIGDVSHRMLQLQMESSEEITLLINSGGGLMNSAYQLCDIMTDLMTAPVRGIALGRCGSAATFIMLHCHQRIGTRYARFLIHSGNMGGVNIPIGEATPEVAQQLLKDLTATTEELLEMYMEKLTPSTWNDKTTVDEKRKFVLELLQRGDQRYDNWINAAEAIEIGLITEVSTEKLGVF